MRRCGQYGADYFAAGLAPVHRACVGLGPDTFAWPSILEHLLIVTQLSFIGALLASVPYYVWRGQYPMRAKAYNRHVWIAFAISCVMWIGVWALAAVARK